LDRILDRATSAVRDGDDVVLGFPDEERSLRIGSPRSRSGPLAPPVDMVLGEPGEVGQVALHDGLHGTLHTVGADLWPARRVGHPYDPRICAPIDLGLQGFYFVDPGTGRLRLWDEVLSDVIDPCDPVEVFLREVCWAVVPGEPHRSTWLARPS
jgi:hypothetical protein